jgi:hypothetical protein
MFSVISRDSLACTVTSYGVDDRGMHLLVCYHVRTGTRAHPAFLPTGYSDKASAA